MREKSEHEGGILTVAMIRYLFSPTGTIIGYLDDNQQYLHDKAGNVIGCFDDKCRVLYKLDDSVYGYLSGGTRRDLFNEAGELIGVFQPSLQRF